MEEKMNRLKNLLQQAQDLSRVASVLSWDQATHMPAKGSKARGRQMAIISQLAQEKATDPEILRLLDELAPYEESLPPDHDDAALLRVTRRETGRLSKIPSAFVASLTAHQSSSFQTWTVARAQNDWKKVEPLLEKTLDLSRELANFFPGYDHIADPLIDFADYGMRAADIRKIFSGLRQELTPLIQQIKDQPEVDDSCLKQSFPKDLQLKFSEQVIRDFGYDKQRGRMDLTFHPFCTMFSNDDVRITTRVNEYDLGDCMFSAMHEAGHALHVMGSNPAYEATPLSSFVSAGLAESQSRTWENLVGRSRGFWEHYFPILKSYFPEQLSGVELETFYRAINKVQPSLIRTEADEVTYNLHPLLRFDLEVALLEGSLAVKDLLEAWNDRYTSDLGITPPDYKDGVLQDVHWYSGIIGGSFQGYTLGNILSAMFYEKALEEAPEIPSQIAKGQFDGLHSWLKERIYWHGAKYTTPEVIGRITGKELDIQPLIRYFKHKFGEIYSL
jgi:carboxypeptidase Taq